MGGSDKAGGARFSVAMADVVRAVGKAERWGYQGCWRTYGAGATADGRGCPRAGRGRRGTARARRQHQKQQQKQQQQQIGGVGLDLNLDLDLEKRAPNASVG